MALYYVNKNAQSNGDHEVHKEDCNYLPYPNNLYYLGSHNSCFSAVEAAKKVYRQSNGCYHCSYACHTG